MKFQILLWPMVGDSWEKGHPHHTCGICCGPTMCRLLISPCLMELRSSQSGKKKNCKALIKVGNFNTFVGGGCWGVSQCRPGWPQIHRVTPALSPEPWDERRTPTFINTSVKPLSIWDKIILTIFFPQFSCYSILPLFCKYAFLTNCCFNCFH